LDVCFIFFMLLWQSAVPNTALIDGGGPGHFRGGGSFFCFSSRSLHVCSHFSSSSFVTGIK
jgi:hypothetical protein